MANTYAQSKIGTLPDNKFLEYTKGSPEYKTLPDVSADGRTLKFMIEVYVDNYINLAMVRSRKYFVNIPNAIIHGMHSVFPANDVDSKDPISEKR